ncbi:MAG: hypothetical protein QM831_34475 [Kofleriaceae bacterium]
MMLLAIVASTTITNADIEQDRAQTQDAALIVRADQTYLDLQAKRVRDLNASWQHEIAMNHPNEAGMLTREHLKALQDERFARMALLAAHWDYTAAREKLVADEYAFQVQPKSATSGRG